MFVCLVNQFRNVLKESILKMKLPPQFVHILKGSVFSLTEKKWQYCQKIFVRLLFLRKKSYICREKVAILPKNLRKVKNMQIKRNFYLQQLIDGKQNGLIKIITGIRRCGKSYLLFTLFKQHLIASIFAEKKWQYCQKIFVKLRICR